MKLKCIRTNCHTGKETEEIHTAAVRIGSGYEAWVYLYPGVTGYESCSVKDLLRERRDKDDSADAGSWHACFGTPESWDKLVVPKEEMERLKDSLRLFDPILEMVGKIAQRTFAKQTEPTS